MRDISVCFSFGVILKNKVYAIERLLNLFIYQIEVISNSNLISFSFRFSRFECFFAIKLRKNTVENIYALLES